MVSYFIHLSPSFSDPKMRLFGVLLIVAILIGALVGGVVGILLPKISTGLSLGALLSLFFGVVSFYLSKVTSVIYSDFLISCDSN
jgi:uncharacterized membrane protein YccC